MKLTMTCIALAFALTGCGGGGSETQPVTTVPISGTSNPLGPDNDDPDPIPGPTTTAEPETTEPETTETETTEPETTEPETTETETTETETTEPETTEPETTETETTEPETPPSTGSASIPNKFYNGTDETDFHTIWRCADVGETNPDNWFAMRFYTDMNGAYGGGGSIFEFSYTISADSVQMMFPDDIGLVQFTNMQFAGDNDFTAKFEAGGNSSPVSCFLIDLEGNPIGNNQPIGPTDPPLSTSEAPYSNGADINTADNIWACHLNQTDVTAFYLLLLETGASTLITTSDDAQYAIEWSENAAGDLEYGSPGEADRFTHINNRFEGNDTMLADAWGVNGQPLEDDTGASSSVQCFRQEVTFTASKFIID